MLILAPILTLKYIKVSSELQVKVSYKFGTLEKKPARPKAKGKAIDEDAAQGSQDEADEASDDGGGATGDEPRPNNADDDGQTTPMMMGA